MVNLWKKCQTSWEHVVAPGTPQLNAARIIRQYLAGHVHIGDMALGAALRILAYRPRDAPMKNVEYAEELVSICKVHNYQKVHEDMGLEVHELEYVWCPQKIQAPTLTNRDMFFFTRLNTFFNNKNEAYVQENGVLTYEDENIFWRHKIAKLELKHQEDFMGPYENLKQLNDNNNTKKDKYGYDELRVLDQAIRFNKMMHYHPVNGEKLEKVMNSRLSLAKVTVPVSILKEKEDLDTMLNAMQDPSAEMDDYLDIGFVPYVQWPVHCGYVSRGMDHQEYLAMKDKFKWCMMGVASMYSEAIDL